jgi:hypothetical protein
MLTPGSRPEPFAARVALRPLPGGGTLAVLPNPHALTVTVAGTLRAGVACVGDGRFTVPTVTAAMLERGTRRHSRLQLARELEDHGLQLSVDAAGSMPAVVAFSGQGLAEELPLLANLLVETLREPVFPADELAKLRQQLLGGLAHEREERPLAFGALTSGSIRCTRSIGAAWRSGRPTKTLREDPSRSTSRRTPAAGWWRGAVDRIRWLACSATCCQLGRSAVAPTTWRARACRRGEEQIHSDRPQLTSSSAARPGGWDADYQRQVLALLPRPVDTLTSRLARRLRGGPHVQITAAFQPPSSCQAWAGSPSPRSWRRGFPRRVIAYAAEGLARRRTAGRQRSSGRSQLYGDHGGPRLACSADCRSLTGRVPRALMAAKGRQVLRHCTGTSSRAGDDRSRRP